MLSVCGGRLGTGNQSRRGGKERTQLMRSVVLALRELMQQTSIDHKTRDLASFLALALLAIDQTVKCISCSLGKTRLWLKADRFRMEWAWAGRLGENYVKRCWLRNWPQSAQIAAAVAEKVKQTEVPKRHGFNTPCMAAWE